MGRCIKSLSDACIFIIKAGIISITAAASTSCGNGRCDILIVGGGASGTTAGIQAARMGCETIIAEETVWIGGMLTSAGVSAIDGNYNLRGGLFGEFTDALAQHYGDYEALKTGWVSNVLFEPSVGESILEDKVAAEPNLTLRKRHRFEKASKTGRGWKVTFSTPEGREVVKARILIDGTELGDVAKACGVKYHVGFDPKSYTGEAMAFEEGNDIVQDLTMVMTLKDYGPDADMTIDEPDGYDESEYVNCCVNPYHTDFGKGQTLWSPEMMVSYGRLQNGKYMINWPVEANDFYANIIEMGREQRDSVVSKAKLHALGFLYFLQTRLGYKNLGLADDEYPTSDALPFFPYHRESRRIEGEYLFTMDEATDRYAFTGYRTGIAVGDYPVDHHHFACPEWRKYSHLWFAKIPSFSLPLGTLVPLEVEDLIVAEKSVSVSNLVNGATRLQPVVCEIGQAAGTLAALAVKGGHDVRDVKVRDVQRALLESGAYLQPYLDLKTDDPDFKMLQRIGCTGILRADGKTVNWSNQSWMRVEDTLVWNDLFLDEYYGLPRNPSVKEVTKAEFIGLLSGISGKSADEVAKETGLGLTDEGLTRLQAAHAIDTLLSPFERDVDFKGKPVQSTVLSR